MEELADLCQKLRSTEEATNVFDSTTHALVRNYLEHKNYDFLVHVLINRTDFGVFLDNYTANKVLDALIQEKNFKLGARVATLIALQEDFEHPITTFMSAYTVNQFLNQLEQFDDLVEKVAEEEVKEEAPKPKKKTKVEEIKIRVNYLINPYFDDHFDLKNSYHLLGKTLLLLADAVQSSNETLANSFQLLGYALYDKFEEGNKFLENGKSANFFKDSVDVVKSLAERVENLEANEPAKKFFETVNALPSLKDENVADIIDGHIKQAIAQQAEKDVEGQKKLYLKWNEHREQRLNEEISRHNRIQRLSNIEQLQKDLEKDEKKLWFFENEDKIDLEIEGKRVYYPKKWFGKLKKPRKKDDKYIPPDVDGSRIR